MATAPTIPTGRLRAGQDMPSDMVRLEGGTFLMGSDRFYAEEAPVHEEHVPAFEIDVTAVTNAHFAEFVAATGYVTTAERPLDPADFPAGALEYHEPGSLVFVPTRAPVDLRNWRQWWHWRAGADWRHPQGPDSSVEDKGDHPVVHVSYEDAEAYARWALKRLPTEPEWEYAARGGLYGAVFAWGDEPQDPGHLRANTWQGRFPYVNAGARGWIGTAPVRSFPSNGYGLFEMTGNTWEWTSSLWTEFHRPREASSCCVPWTPRALSAPVLVRAAPGSRVTKGGSYLCAPEYCFRFRPAARVAQSEDSATSHLGFRCARSS